MFITRPARPEDARDIFEIIKPNIANGSVLPITQAQIEESINSFRVSTDKDKIVSTLRVKHYGKDLELGKFCTLEAYRGKGFAQRLATDLITEAKANSSDSIFAVSTSDELGIFFAKLGFKSIDREKLNQEWLKNYDLSRPSKAYIYYF